MRTKGWAVFLVMASLFLGCGKLPQIVVLSDPLSAEEHNNLGVSYEARGEYGLAKGEFRRALGIKKDFFPAQFNLGNVYLKMGREIEAEEAYRRAMVLDPGQPDVCNNLAELYLRAKRSLDEAQKLAEKAVSLGGPGSYLYLDTLGLVYLRQGKIDQALVCLQDALKTTPAEKKLLLVQIYQHLAEVYGLKGQATEAQRCLDMVVRLTENQ